MVINTPGLWFMSWYDVSIGPNLATYNHVRKTARPEIANQQYAVIAPTLHCAYKRATAETVVGERNMGDARLDYDALTYGWFDTFLKGEKTGLLDTLPKVRYYTMGLNKWQTADTWPPAESKPLTYYLSSGGKANTRQRRRRPQHQAARQGHAGQLHLRSDEAGAVVRRQRLLHRQRGAGRVVRPAEDGRAGRHPGLHQRPAGKRPPR